MGAWNHSKKIDNPYPIDQIREWTALPSGSCPNGNSQIFYNGAIWTTSGSSIAAFPSALRSRAVSKALLQLKANRPNLSVAFAERKQTAELLSSATKKIAQQVRAYKSANPRKWAQIRANGSVNQKRNIPRDWLALQYGWKPLMSDVSQSCQALSDADRASNRYFCKVVGTASQSDRTSWHKVTNLSTLYYFLVTDINKHSCKVVLYYKLRNPILATFSSLGLTNPLSLVWEKLPYSFVVDWFWPIGTWLDSLDADFGWDFITGCRSEMTRLTASSVFRNDGLLPGDAKIEHSGATYSATGMNFIRTVYASSPWAGLPSFKNPLSGLHAANAVALLVQAFRR